MLRGIWDDDQGDGFSVDTIGCIVEGGLADGDAVHVCSDTDEFITIEGNDGDVITVFESDEGDIVNVVIEGDEVVVRVVHCSCCSRGGDDASDADDAASDADDVAVSRDPD